NHLIGHFKCTESFCLFTYPCFYSSLGTCFSLSLTLSLSLHFPSISPHLMSVFCEASDVEYRLRRRAIISQPTTTPCSYMLIKACFHLHLVCVCVCVSVCMCMYFCACVCVGVCVCVCV